MTYANLDGSKNDKTLADIIKWKLDLGPEKRRPVDPAVDTPAPFVVNHGAHLAKAERASLTWIGHASFLVQLGGASILIDPVFSDRLFAIRRKVPPGLAFEHLPEIDAVLVTHNHRDHMDAPSLERLPKHARYVVPKGLGGWFARAGKPHVVELAWYEHTDLADARITFVPSHHWSQRGPFDRNESLWGGFVIEDGTHRVYHSGDTAHFQGFADIFARTGPIHAAMLPIGAYDPRWFMKAQHMSPEDALQAFVALRAHRFVAMHWGTFRLTDEPLGEPPNRIREAFQAARLPTDQLLVPAVGETLLL